MSRTRPEFDRPEMGWCSYCQRTAVAAYRPPLLPFLPGARGDWHCSRCGASGPAVDARAPFAEGRAFDAAMRVQPRVERGPDGRFRTVPPWRVGWAAMRETGDGGGENGA